MSAARRWSGPRPRTTPTSASSSTRRSTRRSSTSSVPHGDAQRGDPSFAWPGTRSPTLRPTTRRSSPGSTRPSQRRPNQRPPSQQSARTCCRGRSISRSSGSSRCATARTRISAGARYRVVGRRSWWDDAVQHGGKELSYLNLYDTEAAWRLVHRFDRPACVIVKHANPCGVAVADDIATAYVEANACDPVSAFGGIVACNRPVTVELATALAPVFTEVVVAPSFEPRGVGGVRPQGQPAPAQRARAVRHRARPALDRRRVVGPTGRPGVRGDRRLAGRRCDPADRRPVGRPRLCLAGLCGGELERDRPRPATAGRSGSVPASRTGSTRPASPANGRPAGLPAGWRRATPSSPLPTDWRPSPQPVSGRSSSPAAACATTR